MATALQIPPEQRSQPVATHEVHLLVESPARWREFFGNLRAAIGPRAGEPGLEEELGRAPHRALAFSALIHVAVASAVVFLFPRIAIDFPVVLDETAREQAVIYYSAPSLPQVEDANASKTSAPGKHPAPADEAFHPVQTIRVSRGRVIRPAVVDAPNLKLPRVAGATANILELPAATASVPQVAPQPVELARVDSKIAKAGHEPQAANQAVPQMQLGQAALPDLSAPTVAPAAPPQPVELARVDSKIPRASREQATNHVPQLPAGQTSLPDLSVTSTPAVVISVKSGDTMALPADGGPGSLSMSPKGRKQLAEAKSPATTTGGVVGSVSTGKDPQPSDRSRASVPGAASGTAPPAADTREAGKNLPSIPGVVVRGGVVTLDSFGPKTPPAANASPEHGASAERSRRAAPITIVATARSGGGLNVYGLFKSQRVYTIYIDTKAGPVVLQFAARDAATESAGELTPPDPIQAEIAAEQSSSSIVISCVLDAEGHVKDLHVVKSVAEAAAVQAILQVVGGWRFHPALSRGKPVEVDALIGIAVGVR